MYEKSNQLIESVAPTPKAVDYRIVLMGQE
jgi:hypothetical protein